MYDAMYVVEEQDHFFFFPSVTDDFLASRLFFLVLSFLAKTVFSPNMYISAMMHSTPNNDMNR